MGYTQPCLRVVSWWFEDIPLVVWGLYFDKVGRIISCLVGPVRGYCRAGPQCLPTPLVSASSIYAAVVCVEGLVSVCYIWSISSVLSGVLCEFKYALSSLSVFLSLSLSFLLSFSLSLLLSFFLSFFFLSLSEDLSPRTMPQD